MRKLLAALLVLLAGAFAFAGCTEIVAVEGVKLDKETLALVPGESFTLTATVTPENAFDKAVTWTSAEEAVATVDENGKVTAVAEGTATVTVTTKEGGKSASCEVTVTNPVLDTGVTLSAEQAKIDAAGELTLTATVLPENASDKTVVWTSSDPDVASVEGGVVTGVKAGTATITATTANGNTAACAITVMDGVEKGYAGGDGSVTNPYLIANIGNWMTMAKSYRGDKPTVETSYKLTADLDLSTAAESPTMLWFRGTLDGDGHALDLSAVKYRDDYWGVIEYTVGTSEFKNLVLDFTGSTQLSRAFVTYPNFRDAAVGTTTFRNVDAKGNFDAGTETNEGIYTGSIFGSKTAFIDCDNYADYNNDSYGAVFVGGYLSLLTVKDSALTMELSFENCNNYGTLTGPKVAVAMGNNSQFYLYPDRCAYSAVNCRNYGLIRANVTGGTFMHNFPDVSADEAKAAKQAELNAAFAHDTAVLDGKTYQGKLELLDYAPNVTIAADGTVTLEQNSQRPAAYFVVNVEFYASLYTLDGTNGGTWRQILRSETVAAGATVSVKPLKIVDSRSGLTPVPNGTIVSYNGENCYFLNATSFVDNQTLFYAFTSRYEPDSTAEYRAANTYITVSAYDADGNMIGYVRK